MTATVYDYEHEKEHRMTERANDYQRLAEKYAAELIDKLCVPHTYDEAVTMIAVAYLEGSMATLK